MSRDNHIEPIVDLTLAKEHGLSEEEYQRILDILGRVPTFTELGIYSVMWSEHCSYKNSIAQLKTLPRTGGRLLVAAGEENAGLVDIGDGLAIAFKIESHNHPSAIEPYQGAATGVGGILRDIFTMGARPIATLNSLRFGNLDNERVRYLFTRVVKGIGDYGNSFGVPTVAGEVYFDECYTGNPLVNAMAVGIVEHAKTARAVAKGVGNPVFIVGSVTGRDGIHGATFASEELSDQSESKRPSVQVGDPFTEKRLLEATLEAISTGSVIGIQDMGAAGLTCSSTEMSAKGKVGMRIHVDRVPLREEKMTPYEIMLSESQERMLLVGEKGHEESLINIFKRWDLSADRIGEITDSPNVEVWVENTLKASVPPGSLVLGEGAPVYVREARKPEYLLTANKLDEQSLEMPKDLGAILLELLGRPTIASKRFVWEQYDSMVRTNTIVSNDGDAAVVRIKDTRRAIALKTDCNARYVYLNPYRGTQIAVAEAARNIVCVGAKPIAITNCLNFGNPYDPEVFWQFREAVRGMGDACRAFETPVTGGNVSFYNESPLGAVYPTPVIGMLGLIEDVEKVVDAKFKSPGDVIILLGENRGEIGGSEYVLVKTGKVLGEAPTLDLESEKRLQMLVCDLLQRSLIRSAHDVSEGGLAVALAECSFAEDGIGVNVRLDSSEAVRRKDFLLFGESQSLVVVSAVAQFASEILAAANERKVKAGIIGEVTGDGQFEIQGAIRLRTAEARELYENAIARMVQRW